MTDLTIWFGIWDDYVERLEDPEEAEDFRSATKIYVAQSFGLTEHGSKSMPLHPLIRNFGEIAEKIRGAYDIGEPSTLFLLYRFEHEKLTSTKEQRVELLRHFDQYIDATRIETEFEKSESVPSLERYWEVRTLTSGMGTLLGMSE
jgi:hypothetical protein